MNSKSDLIYIERVESDEEEEEKPQPETTDNNEVEMKLANENEPERVIYINSRNKDDELQKEGATVNILIEASRKRKTNIFEVN